MLTLIIFSTVTFCIETLPNFYEHETDTTSVWFIMEATCIAVFTAEFLGRLSSTPDLRNYFNDTMNIIDVVAIMPFYLEIMLANVSIPGLSVFRVVRLVRVFRLFKVSRGSLTVRIQRFRATACSTDCFGFIVASEVEANDIRRRTPRVVWSARFSHWRRWW